MFHAHIDSFAFILVFNSEQCFENIERNVELTSHRFIYEIIDSLDNLFTNFHIIGCY